MAKAIICPMGWGKGLWVPVPDVIQSRKGQMGDPKGQGKGPGGKRKDGERQEQRGGGVEEAQGSIRKISRAAQPQNAAGRNEKNRVTLLKGSQERSKDVTTGCSREPNVKKRPGFGTTSPY